MTDAHATTRRPPTPPTNGGRPKGAKSMRAAASRHVDRSIEVLAAVQDDEEAPYMARVVAAQTILTTAGMTAGKAGRE